MKQFSVILLLIAALSSTAISAVIPGQTLFSAERCQGSRMPYAVPDSQFEWPDSLIPVMINHMGRHGARYPTSESHFHHLIDFLEKAREKSALTEKGEKLLKIASDAVAKAQNRWGELDSLGVAEQKGIAERMYTSFPQLFIGQQVDAVSSYVPRCVASMDAFVQKINELSNGKAEISADSGREYSRLLRPFETDSAYVEFANKKPYASVLQDFTAAEQPIEVAYSMVSEDISPEKAEKIVGDIYYVISTLSAMEMHVDWSELFTLEEYNRMWQVDNLRQYLARTASTISTLPAEITSDLIWDLIETTDDFIEGTDSATVYLRFGHAETIMPLASQLRLPGCYYLTHYFDTVALHWQSWNVVPMAANVRQILFKSESGNYYLRTDLNERPVTLIPGCDDIYVPWERARYFMAAVTGIED